MPITVPKRVRCSTGDGPAPAQVGIWKTSAMQAAASQGVRVIVLPPLVLDAGPTIACGGGSDKERPRLYWCRDTELVRRPGGAAPRRHCQANCDLSAV